MAQAAGCQLGAIRCCLGSALHASALLPWQPHPSPHWRAWMPRRHTKRARVLPMHALAQPSRPSGCWYRTYRIRQHLEAMEALQRASLFNWFQATTSGAAQRDVAMQEPSQQELLRRLGCSRFRAAMAEYARQVRGSRRGAEGQATLKATHRAFRRVVG